ncbi:hypothetical protein CPB83DRAFT_283303 [Crepidotus variabilis]|uniref:Uncharacterized protein n=1 Tax=Crepidotus variabilis TaxID=179855 RepID=A0A9P6EHN1_9AGAR|nr:hypothetical protein CPB83DRAFT_283303 [Crepidotus variabilis]
MDAAEGKHVDPVELDKNAQDLIGFYVKSEKWDSVVRVRKSLMKAEEKILGPMNEKTIQSKQALATLYRSLGRMLEWQELRFQLL